MEANTQNQESVSGENYFQSGIKFESYSSKLEFAKFHKEKRFLFFAILAILFTSIGYSQVNPNYHYVKGHYRSNGIYVKGYYRTNPNSTINDNYSTYPNVNPHTGKIGTVKPQATTPRYTIPSTTRQSHSTPSYSVPKKPVPVYSTPRTTTPSYSIPKSTLPVYSKPRTTTPSYSIPKTNRSTTTYPSFR